MVCYSYSLPGRRQSHYKAHILIYSYSEESKSQTTFIWPQFKILGKGFSLAQLELSVHLLPDKLWPARQDHEIKSGHMVPTPTTYEFIYKNIEHILFDKDNIL